MKRLLYTLTALLLFLSSCEDYLEVKPTNEIAIASLTDIKSLQASALYSLANPTRYPYVAWLTKPAGENFFYPTAQTKYMFSHYANDLNNENMFTSKYWSRPADMKRCLRWNYTNMHSQLWDVNYLSIGYQNEIIYQLENLDIAHDEEWEVCYAEAKVMRSLLIFKTFQYFSTFNDINAGIPLNLNPEEIVSSKKTRWTQTEVFEQIISDLKDVEELKVKQNPSYNIMYSKDILNMLTAQVYLYKGTGPCAEETDWANARMYAEKAIKDRVLFTDATDLKAAFTSNPAKGHVNKNNMEAALIFSWGNKAGNQAPNLRAIAGNEYSRISNYITISPELHDLFSENDIRLSAFFTKHPFFEDEPETLVETKYTIDGWEVSDMHVMFRTAEMKLIIAESYAREGNDAQAITELQAFKDARQAGVIEGSIMDEILNERRKEFFIEGDYRWLDMKRNQMSMTRTFKEDEQSEHEYEEILEANDFRYAFMIPVHSELNYNFRLTQNPGWDTFNED